MAYRLKRLKSFIAPMLVLYTVLVTFFLAQTAWDDVSKRLRKGTDVRFLDVLVQEERRHLRSFQNVVKNYRGVMQIEMQDNSDDNPALQDPSLNQSNSYALGTVRAQNVPPEALQENDLPDYDNNDSVNDTVLTNELKARLEQYHQVIHNRPTFQVEVEEWDESSVHHRSVPKQTGRLSDSASYGNPQTPGQGNNARNAQFDSNKDGISRGINSLSVAKWKNYTNSRGDLTYTTVYCDDVFQDEQDNQVPICKRELADNGSDRHVNISSSTLLFRELGGSYIYSAFLDMRNDNFTVRLITIGHQGLHGTKSVFWCVFPSFLPNARPNFTQNSWNQKSGVNAYNETSTSSQMTYYAASDGHQKSNQFYIMSCPVPEAVKNTLLTPRRGVVQIVVGSTEWPFLGSVQETLTVKLIINTPQNSRQAGVGIHHSYFDKMENDLRSLNMSSIRSIGNNGNNNNDDNGDNNNNNNSIMSVIHDSYNNSDFRNQSVVSSPEDKIVICVAPLQGGEGVIKLTEFIELSLLLGSQHIVFYTFRVSDDATNVLRMYQNRGLVTVLTWNLPAPNSIWAKGRDAALNDCLYRTMHIYDYGLFLDLDEFFVPRITPDLPSFLKYLKAVHRFNATKISDILFSSAYFPPPNKVQFQNLTTTREYTRDVSKFISLKSIHRSYFNPQHTLRMIKLTKALRVGAGERKRTSFTISPRFATVNHFSHCPQEMVPVNSQNAQKKLLERIPSHNDLGKGPDDQQSSQETDRAQKTGTKTSDFCSHTKVDWIMWRYKLKLIERTKDSLRQLNKGQNEQ